MENHVPEDNRRRLTLKEAMNRVTDYIKGEDPSFSNMTEEDNWYEVEMETVPEQYEYP